MISSRIFLAFAAICSLCQASTAFRSPGTNSARSSWVQKTWPRQNASQSSKQSSANDSSTKRFATVAFPQDEVDFTANELDKVDRPPLMKRIKSHFFKRDGMTSKQRLAKMGLDVILSYGFVQNVSYTISTSLAWYLFSAQTGLSPLAPGQWKPFLAINAGFMVFQNLIRPVHVALAVVVSPYFDRAVESLEKRFKLSHRASIFITALMVNLVGTLALMGGGICVAAAAAGVAIFP